MDTNNNLVEVGNQPNKSFLLNFNQGDSNWLENLPYPVTIVNEKFEKIAYNSKWADLYTKKEARSDFWNSVKKQLLEVVAKNSENLNQGKHLLLNINNPLQTKDIDLTLIVSKIYKFQDLNSVLLIQLLPESLDLEFKQKLIDTERYIKLITDNMQSVVYAFDMDGKTTYINKAIEKLTGFDQDDIKTYKDVDKYTYFESRDELQRLRQEVFTKGFAFTDKEFQIIQKNGKIVWCSSTWNPILDEFGRQVGVEGRERDITRRKNAELSLIESEYRFRLMADTAPVLIWLMDENGKFVFLNKSFTDFIGIQSQNLEKIVLYDLIHRDDLSKAKQKIEQTVKHKESCKLEFRLLDAQNKYRWIIYNMVPRFDDKGDFYGYIGTIIDINERKDLEQKLQFEAFYDSLTGLPNRKNFIRHLQGVLDDYRFHHKKYAILFIDVDRFKIINDSLGHLAGDKLLIHVSEVLKSSLRQNDFIARLGGDEFIIIYKNPKSPKEVKNLVKRLKNVIKKPIVIDNYNVVVTLSIGIAMSKSHYLTAEDVLRDSDTAMYKAKNQGGDGFEIFNNEMHSRVLQILKTESELRNALKNNELEIFYQPIFDLKQNIMVSCEALIRWKHKTKGYLAPESFLSIAEELGLISEIDMWALKVACQQTKIWQDKTSNIFSISVNLSKQNFKSKELVENIIKIVDSSGLDRSCLILEVTENLVIDNLDQAIRIMRQLQEKGVRLYLDDFGTGYSSLTYLKDLPLNGVKIDKRFIDDLETDPRSQAVTKTIIDLSHQLNLKVVAEGVEKETTIEILKDYGCNSIQGFWYNKPLSKVKFSKLLEGKT